MAFTLLLEGDLAPASGWLARAHRLLEPEQRECAEHGFLLLPAAVQASAAGDFASAEAAAARAAEIGARVGDADLLTLALHFQGRALVSEGRVPAGLMLLDEAMVAVVAGEVWPPVAGNVYCSMISSTRRFCWRPSAVWDWRLLPASKGTNVFLQQLISNQKKKQIF